MSQRTQALALLSPLGAVVNVQTIRSLRTIVETAQNGGDGSLDEKSWTILRDICVAGEKLIALVEGVR